MVNITELPTTAKKQLSSHKLSQMKDE